MTTANIESQVIGIIAKWAEVEPERLSPTTRLLHDLAIDGDDAVGLFEQLRERFGTDLTQLHLNWNEHFGPEGIPGSTAFGVICAGLAVQLVCRVAGDVAGLATGVAFFVGWLWLRRQTRDELTPITVADVAHAVHGGAWPA